MEFEALKNPTERSALPRARTSAYEGWKRFREKIERDGTKSNITRYYPRRRWKLFSSIIYLFAGVVWLLGLRGWGKKRALNLKLNKFEVFLPHLPKAFDGYQVAHLTDLHFDRLKGLEERIVKLLKKEKLDLVVLTGDFKDRMTLPPFAYEKPFSYLGKYLRPKHGMYAVLGNHDSADLVPVIEKHGIQVLINESVEISNENARITVTGVDDVHYFYTPLALKALDEAPANAFKLLLVHSPEMVKEAADRGYSLYLCGHTHAGQVALPGGKALFTHVNTGKEYSKGLWKHENLQGYTSSGTGVSGATLRFFTDSEIALITLRCHTPFA